MAAATAIAVVGLAVGITTTAVSFANAEAQKKKQQKAERDADKAMNEARGKLDVNFAEQMTIKKEAYDNEREALLVQGAMATNAGVESERGSAATAGRVYAAQVAGQAEVRGAMADELTNIENAVIEEDSRLRDLDVALDLEEVAGNQLKAANAQEAAEKNMSEGISGAIDVAGQAASFAPLYSQNISSQRAAVGGMQQTNAMQGQGNANAFAKMNSRANANSNLQAPTLTPSLGGTGGGINNSVTYNKPVAPKLGGIAAPSNVGQDYQSIGNMNNAQFIKWKRQNPNSWNKMKTSQGYTNNYLLQ
tara:strand:+ start:2591 stop:3508 length:918 start_codon:yes stop_codon:yes gene_type:complete